MTARDAAARLTTLFWLPSQVVEEALHALALWPWAERVGIVVEPASGDARTDVAVDSEATPEWALTVSWFAPTIAGVVLGVAVLVAVASGARFQPNSLADLVGALAATFWWMKLTRPDPLPEDSAHAN